jgi:hypothetical protein
MKDGGSSLQDLAQNERGGIGIIVLVIVFIAILLTPVFLDLARVYYGRRVAQTGADAAALAAAKEYAEWLSGRWEGECGDPPEDAILDYRQEVVDVAWSGIGYAWAEDYAMANDTRLVHYASYPLFEDREDVAGVPLPRICVDTKAERSLDLWMEDLYDRGFSSPAEARAGMRLNDADWRPEVCWIEGERDTRYIFTFSWGIRLVK